MRKLYRIAAECGATVAYFTVHEVNERAQTLALLTHGATMRDLAKLGIQRRDVESLKINESVDLYGAEAA